MNMAYAQQTTMPDSYDTSPSYRAENFNMSHPPPPPPKPSHADTSPPPHSTRYHDPTFIEQHQEGPQQLDQHGSASADQFDPYAQQQKQQLQRHHHHHHQQQQQQYGEGGVTSPQSPGQVYGQNQDQLSSQQPATDWIPEIVLQQSHSDIQNALADPEIVNALLNSTSSAPSSMKDSTARLQHLLETNIAYGQRVQALYNTLIAQREHTSAHFLAVRGLEQQWKKKQFELERKLEPWGPRELHQRLGASIVDAERMCKGLEESFLDDVTRGEGEIASERETAEWVKRIREARRLVALRRERKSRWDEGRVGGWR